MYPIYLCSHYWIWHVVTNVILAVHSHGCTGTSNCQVSRGIVCVRVEVSSSPQNDDSVMHMQLALLTMSVNMLHGDAYLNLIFSESDTYILILHTFKQYNGEILTQLLFIIRC